MPKLKQFKDVNLRVTLFNRPSSYFDEADAVMWYVGDPNHMKKRLIRETIESYCA